MNIHVSTIEFATVVWAFILIAAIFYSAYAKEKQRSYRLDKRLRQQSGIR